LPLTKLAPRSFGCLTAINAKALCSLQSTAKGGQRAQLTLVWREK
jgi:hypothetical protein